MELPFIQAMWALVGGFLTVSSAVAFGIYDRKRTANKEAKDRLTAAGISASGEMSALFLEIKADRDNHEKRADDAEAKAVANGREIDYLWAALRALAESAHNLRHEAARLIGNYCIRIAQLENRQLEKADIPELPKIISVQRFYEAEKTKPKDAD